MIFPFRWLAVGAGQLAVWHRPKFRAIPYLKEAGCSHVVTLLSEKEGGQEIGKIVRSSGMEWIWLPLSGGLPPEGSAKSMLLAALSPLSEILDRGGSMLIHCSAGIHRSGMLTYALLRRRGFSELEALNMISQMRQVTATGLERVHIEWGNSLL